MLMMGMPFAFVDTSDMWFGTRWSRIVVTLSGPLSTAAVAGTCSLVAAYVPNPIVAGIAFQIAFALYLNTIYNLNPWTHLITSYRNIAYNGTAPDWAGLAGLSLASVVMLAGAILLFKRVEPTFAKVL